MIVADTNIISYFLLPTSFSESVDKLYKSDSHWTAPMLWRSEFRNILALYLRKDLISFEKAIQLQDSAELLMQDNEYNVTSTQVLSLVRKSNCSAYDCEFISMAQYLNTKLVTQDKKILKEFPSIAISVAQYLTVFED
ncbi:MAG: type II toxin-antitoxin system VapC family toxin [Gammaproteobacteria bacterium]|nr:type II toxin-antitoxin system VapC family toxin [Gammaproteobacteria bacterium]